MSDRSWSRSNGKAAATGPAISDGVWPLIIQKRTRFGGGLYQCGTWKTDFEEARTSMILEVRGPQSRIRPNTRNSRLLPSPERHRFGGRKENASDGLQRSLCISCR